MFVALFVTLQWPVMSFLGVDPGVYAVTSLAGLCIFSSAFILSWAAELSQFYISQALAFILLALIAVLPEYSVDMYFAWTAGKNPEYIAYAAANMTGGNRLLVGFGWPLIVFLYWLKTKKTSITLEAGQKMEINVLLFATVYSFIIPLKGNFNLMDAAVLISVFIYYVVQALKLNIKEPELEGGPVEMLSKLPSGIRLFITSLFFSIAGYSIYAASGPFAEGLLEVGARSGIDKFILVQWLAPLASEAPEIIVVIIFTLKLMPREGFRALVSSKVNQWSLLVGMLPLVYSISAGHVGAMHLDARQTEEILLTSSQSLFAIMVIYNLEFTLLEAGFVFILFASQLFFTTPAVRYGYCVVYLVLSAVFFFRQKKGAGNLIVKIK